MPLGGCHAVAGSAWLALNGNRGPVVARRVMHANTFWRRLRGLMGRRSLMPDEGLLLDPCNAIHTFFMRFPIDALFLDAEGRVVGVVESMPLWRWRIMPGARAVLELAAGTVARTGIRQGDRIRLVNIKTKPGT